MVRPRSDSPILSEAPSSLPHSDDLDNLLLDFDSIDEWFVDIDPFLMSAEEAKGADSGGLDSNKADLSVCAVMPGDPSSEISAIGVKGEFLCSSIGEGIKHVSLVEACDQNPNDVAIFERVACEHTVHKTDVTCGLVDANATVRSCVDGSDESEVAKEYTELIKDNEVNKTYVSSLVKVANENAEESSGSESGRSDNEDDDSDSSDTSSSSDDDSEDGYQDTDDEEAEFSNNVRGGRGLHAAGELEECGIRNVDQDEMVFGSDEDEDVVKGPIRSKNEVEDLHPVPKIDATLEPHHQTLPVGVVSAIFDNKVIVEGSEKHSPLNEGSILWITEARSPLGLVDEIFGPVKNPFYIVRYNSADELSSGIIVGTGVSFVPEFATHILNHAELCKKAYDASGDNDEELSDEVEFSDDEKETEYRKSLRLSKRGNNNRQKGNSESFVDKRNFKAACVKKDKHPSVDVTQMMDKHSTSASGHVQSPVEAGSLSCSNHNSFGAAGPVHPAAEAGSLSCSNYNSFGAAGPVHPPVEAGSFSCNNHTSFGAGNAYASSPATLTAIPQAAQMSNPFGLLPQQLQQQLNALWLNGFPNPLQQQGIQGGLALNMLSNQLLGNQPFPQLLPTQSFNNFLNGATFQHQFIPNLQAPANVPWFGGLMSPSTMPHGSLGNGNSSQQTSGNMLEQGAASGGQNSGWPPPAGQGLRLPRPHNPGRSSFLGTNARPRGGNRRSFYGRGGQPRNSGRGAQPHHR